MRPTDLSTTGRSARLCFSAVACLVSIWNVLAALANGSGGESALWTDGTRAEERGGGSPMVLDPTKSGRLTVSTDDRFWGALASLIRGL
jgi:hypothetical protein